MAICTLAWCFWLGCSQQEKWELAWSDEFEYTGSPAEESWGYESGYIRNKELQYYSSELKNVRVETVDASSMPCWKRARTPSLQLPSIRWGNRNFSTGASK
jgi:hypothetical protein